MSDDDEQTPPPTGGMDRARAEADRDHAPLFALQWLAHQLAETGELDANQGLAWDEPSADGELRARIVELDRGTSGESVPVEASASGSNGPPSIPDEDLAWVVDGSTCGN